MPNTPITPDNLRWALQALQLQIADLGRTSSPTREDRDTLLDMRRAANAIRQQLTTGVAA